MNWKKDFLWPFSGLKIGCHETQILLPEAFFKELDQFEIISGEGEISAKLEKKETMLLLSLNLEAQLTAGCDRCSETLCFAVTGTMDLVYKFGDEPSFDESLVVLPKDAFQLDLFQPCFELAVISLPTRYVHSEQECNQEVIKLLQKTQNESTDPRWDSLKKHD
jgi:uncharacterized metal-binding protein YceD (DUF177 family)